MRTWSFAVGEALAARALLVLLVVFAPVAFAATCYEYKNAYDATWFQSKDAAAGAAAQRICRGYNSTTDYVGGITYTGSEGLSYTVKCRDTFYSTGDPRGQPSNSGPNGLQRRVGTCQCDGTHNNEVHSYSGTGGGDGPPAQICDGGCKAGVNGVAVKVGSTWAGRYQRSASSCSGDEADGTRESDDDAEQCKSSGEFTVCTGKNVADGKCGYVNDELVCVKKTPKGGCLETTGGARVCDATAGTPPVPDTGTRGEKATPDGTFGAAWADNNGSPVGGATFNYYGSGTVGGSSAGSMSGDGGSAVGNPQGGSSGTVGGVEDGEDEEEEGSCEGDECTLTGPVLEEPDGWGAVTSAFFADAQSAPIFASLVNLGQSVPAGECPTVTISMWSQEYTLDAHCTLLSGDVMSVLSVVMLALWGFVGLRIVFSA